MSEHAGISSIWTQARERLPQTKDGDLDAEINYVLKYLQNNAPELYSGIPVPRRTQQDIVNLARDLSAKVPEASVQARFSFLSIGFEIGNKEHGWNVPLVPQLVRVEKPQNWATIDNFSDRARAARIERSYGIVLENPPSSDFSTLLGQLLFTAIFFGGLLEQVWLEPFLNAVINREFFQHKGILWLEMVKKTKLSTDENDETIVSSYTKRFFPDNYSLILLYRLLDKNMVPCAMPCPKPWNLLKSFLKTIPGLSDLTLPNTLNEFMKVAISRNLFLPGSMLSYASGRLKSTSLAIEPWLRCISGKAVSKIRLAPQEIPKNDAKIASLIVPRNYSSRRQDALFDEMMEEIGPKNGVDLSPSETKAIFERMLADHRNELSFAFQLLLYWGRQLLTPRKSYLERRSKKGAVTNSTVRRYFSAIGSALLLVAEDQNLTTLDLDVLELLYEQIIDDRQSDDAMAPQCLFQFHGFLQAFFDRPPIESIELKGATPEATNLNANLITQDVYILILCGLGWGRGSMSRWQRLRVMAWVICYRCGLRPSEVLKLRVIDFQMVGAKDYELLVRVSPKTERGRRRVPASSLLSPEERDLLLEYYLQRCSEVDLYGDNYLFAHPEQQSGRLIYEEFYAPVIELLRTITLDDTIRLYHTRHTFNSGLQVQLLLRGKPLLNQDKFLNLESSIDQDRLLRAACMGNEHCGRKDQQVQCILVGHSSPEITNKYYNHLSDALLGTLVRQRRDVVPISLATVTTLGGMKQSWAAELLEQGRNDHPLAALVKLQAKKHASLLEHPLLTHAASMSLPDEEKQEISKLPPWEDVLTQEMTLELRKGEGNWDYASKLYERISRLKGKRFRSIVNIIQDMSNQLENSKKRWRGPIYSGISELRSVLKALHAIKVSAQSIVLVHHPRRGQSEEEQSAALKMWQERLEMPVWRWLRGELANASAPKKGIMELRVLNTTDIAQAGKLPPVNRGFEITVQLLGRCT